MQRRRVILGVIICFWI